jgi:putative ABC transport system substrate-binding protein
VRSARCHRSNARPGGNATGIYFFVADVAAKRLGLLHDLVPKATRIAVLVNPENTSTAEAARRDMPEAARALGVTIEVLNASTSREIEAAFAVLVRNRAVALFVAADGFLNSRRVQFATLTARHGVPSAYSQRVVVEAGGLMSYGTDILDMFRQVGVYTGQILRGAPTCRSCSRPNSSSSSTCKQRERLASRCPTRSSCLADEVID